MKGEKEGQQDEFKKVTNQNHPMHSKPPYPPETIVEEEEETIQEVDHIDNMGGFTKKNIYKQLCCRLIIFLYKSFN